jgi:hypothetical protein
MCSFHEQLKENNRQAKAIVLDCSINGAEVVILQFGRRILPSSYRAAEHMGVVGIAYLKRIRIDERDQRTRRSQNVAAVYVSHQVATFVDGGKGCRQVPCCLVQITPVEQRTGLPPARRIIEIDDGEDVVHAPHDEADDLAAPIEIAQQINRPGDGDVSLGRHGIIDRTRNHQRQLARSLDAGLMVNLREKRRILWDRIDAALASRGQRRGAMKADCRSRTHPQQPHGSDSPVSIRKPPTAASGHRRCAR